MLLGSLCEIPSTHVDWEQNTATRGLFLPYIAIVENFKSSLQKVCENVATRRVWLFAFYGFSDLIFA